MYFRFADYILDTRRFELRRDMTTVPLRPKAYQLLAFLITHRERVVAKDELFSHLWPKQFVGDATLNSCLKEVRKAIGDSGQAQRIVQTIRKRGYRFVAPVIEENAVPAPPTPEQAPVLAPDAHAHRPGQTRPCPACSNEQSATASFCTFCGARLDVQCQKCGEKTAMPAAYCPACGAQISYTKTKSSRFSLFGQEYKQVTVLRCKVFNAASVLQALGEEISHHLMQIFLNQASDVIDRFGGSITQRSGEGFTALFGAPRAYEDHALRGVLASIELRQKLQTSITQFKRTLRDQPTPTTPTPTPKLCMGLHSGPVVIGFLQDDPTQLYTAAGVTTRLADELLHRAGADSILLSSTIFRLTRNRVITTKVGSLVGDDKKVSIYRVKELRAPPTTAHGRRNRYRYQFIGRRQELQILEQRLSLALQGQGQIVAIIGEPGIGKSRLLHEFLTLIPDTKIQQQCSFCVSYGNAIPYLPVTQLLKPLCGIGEHPTREQAETALKHTLRLYDITDQEISPYLLPLFDHQINTAKLDELSPQSTKRRTLAAIRQLILKISLKHPLIISLEDTHWMDSASAEVLDFLINSVAGAPILILATHRPGYHPPWSEKSYVTQIALQRFVQQESEQLLRERFADRDIPPSAIQSTLKRADGNPFFLEELASNLLSRNNVFAEQDIPSTVQDVIMARIDQLPRQTKQILQMASLFGRQVPLELLQTLVSEEVDIETHLSQLEHQEFLYENVGSVTPEFSFNHGLTQEVVYAGMLSQQRQSWHGVVAQTLEEKYGHQREDVVDLLAYHYARSAIPEKAVSFLFQLGLKAAGKHAHAEALAAYAQALQQTAQLPQAEGDRQRIDIVLKQAFSLSVLGRFTEILQTLQPYREQIDKWDDAALTGPFFFRLGMTSAYLGDLDESDQCAKRALAAARLQQDETLIGYSFYVLAFGATFRGNFRHSIRFSREAIARFETNRAQHWLGLSHLILGIASGYVGRFAAALDALQKAGDIGLSSDDTRLQCLADNYRGWLYILRGEFDRGVMLCQQSLARSSDPFDPVVRSSALRNLGTAYLALGDTEQAVSHLTQGLDQTKQSLLRGVQGQYFALLAEAFLARGEIEKAYQFAAEGLQNSKNTNALYQIGVNQRALAQIYDAQQKTGDARTLMHEAYLTFKSIGAFYDLGRTLLLTAELEYASSSAGHNAAGARRALTKAHRIFRRLNIPAWVRITEQAAQACKVSL